MTEVIQIGEADFTVVYRGEFSQRYFTTIGAAATFIRRKDILIARRRGHSYRR